MWRTVHSDNFKTNRPLRIISSNKNYTVMTNAFENIEGEIIHTETRIYKTCHAPIMQKWTNQYKFSAKIQDTEAHKIHTTTCTLLGV